MARQNGPGFSEVLEQAMDMFTDSLKASVKFQEDVARLWGGNFSAPTGGAQEWQRRSQSIWADFLPVAQKQADEYLKLFDGNYRAGVELAKKMAEATRSESLGDAQAKARQLLDQSIEALRNSSQAMTEANVRAMQSWAELIRNGIQAATEAARETANSAAEQAKTAVENAQRQATAA